MTVDLAVAGYLAGPDRMLDRRRVGLLFKGGGPGPVPTVVDGAWSPVLDRCASPSPRIIGR